LPTARQGQFLIIASGFAPLCARLEQLCNFVRRCSLDAALTSMRIQKSGFTVLGFPKDRFYVTGHDRTFRAAHCNASRESITPRRLPGFAWLRQVSNWKPVCEKAELLTDLAPAAPLVRSQVGRAHPQRTKIRTGSRSIDDQLIDAATGALLAGAARRNSGMSRSGRRVARNSVVRIEDRSACPIQERHR
jgi:hypothetical protein